MNDETIGFKKPEWIFIAFNTNFVIVFFFFFQDSFYSQATICTHGDSTKVVLNRLKNSIINYHLSTGNIPQKLEELVTKPENIRNWRQTLEEVPKDLWDNEFIYSISKNMITIISHGPSDKEDDDIFLKFTLRKKEDQ